LGRFSNVGAELADQPITISVVIEPVSWTLLSSGVLGLAAHRRAVATTRH